MKIVRDKSIFVSDGVRLCILPDMNSQPAIFARNEDDKYYPIWIYGNEPPFLTVDERASFILPEYEEVLIEEAALLYTNTIPFSLNTEIILVNMNDFSIHDIDRIYRVDSSMDVDKNGDLYHISIRTDIRSYLVVTKSPTAYHYREITNLKTADNYFLFSLDSSTSFDLRIPYDKFQIALLSKLPLVDKYIVAATYEYNNPVSIEPPRILSVNHYKGIFIGYFESDHYPVYVFRYDCDKKTCIATIPSGNIFFDEPDYEGRFFYSVAFVKEGRLYESGMISIEGGAGCTHISAPTVVNIGITEDAFMDITRIINPVTINKGKRILRMTTYSDAGVYPCRSGDTILPGRASVLIINRGSDTVYVAPNDISDEDVEAYGIPLEPNNWVELNIEETEWKIKISSGPVVVIEMGIGA